MALEKIILPGFATLSSPDDLEWLDSGAKVALKPRYGTGEHIVVLSHLDETNSDTIYKWVRMFKDWAYDARFIGRDKAKWNTTDKEFGTACLEIDHDQAALALPYHSRYNNLDDFTIEFFVKFTSVSNKEVLCNEYYKIDSWGFGRWFFRRYADEFYFHTFDSEGNSHALATSGLGLQADQYYHVRFSHCASGEVWISVDGNEVAHSYDGKVLATLDETICPFVTLGGIYDHPSLLNSLVGTETNPYVLDEFVMSDEVLPSNYDVPTSAIKPFSQDEPTATQTLDSGSNDSTWDASSIAFIDEADFDNSGIKLRWNADNDNTPNFTGDPHLLSEFKSSEDPVGRYLHLEFTFYSDGDTKRILFLGKIDVCSGKPSILVRRAPEIVRR